MLELSCTLKKNLSQKKILQISVGYMCLQIIENFFENKIKVTGKMKNGKLIVSATPRFIHSEIYKNQQQIIQNINEKLGKLGISNKINQIIIK